MYAVIDNITVIINNRAGIQELTEVDTMKTSRLLAVFLTTLISTTVGAVTVGPELISDPDFDDPSRGFLII